MTAPSLRFEQAVFTRGAFRFESGIVEPPAGRVTVLLGPNGGGKTTALRLAAGLLQPVAGAVRLDGSAVSTIPPARRAGRIAYVPQRPDVGLPFSVREVVALGHTARASDTVRVDWALSQVGLSGDAGRPFHALSGGQQQRTAVARALAQHRPGGLLLLDEAFSAVDPPESAALVACLRRLAAEGATILVATHDLAVAAALADAAWLVRGGRTVACGEAADLLTPERLSGFLGAPMATAHAAGGRRFAVPDLRGPGA